jgi:hypothetical protein
MSRFWVVLVPVLVVVLGCGRGGERNRAARAAAGGTAARAAAARAADAPPVAGATAPGAAALGATAPIPASSATLAVGKPNFTVTDRASFRRVLGWSEDCEQGFDATDPGYGGVEVDTLAPGRYLVGVVCTRGAYQGYRIYFYYDETRQPPAARPLVFETRESPDEGALVRTTTRELWGLPAFDRKTRQLRVLNKFRGPGDCGTLATYKFVAGVPELAELRAKLACDGKGAEEPERWPPVPLH